ncbi:MAG: hypothetical protein SOT80_01095 [Candidatus Pseudoruminococcus sp.]|nr:hypothetical protein [Ruminococcus sp.]MDY2781982.1 hypothetical protein [Candidatus Pseudoruminococcus sp.]
MPVLILLGIFLICGIIDLHKTCKKNVHPHSRDEVEQMLSKMVGKSKRETRHIVKYYRK